MSLAISALIIGLWAIWKLAEAYSENRAAGNFIAACFLVPGFLAWAYTTIFN
jgi:hypothetical protein